MRGETDNSRVRRAPQSHFSLWEVLSFLIVVGAISVGCYYVMIHNKRQELITGKIDLNDVHTRLDATRKIVESKRNEVAELQGKANRLDELERQKSAFETEIPTAAQELASLRTEFSTAVRQERAKAAGTTHPELRLVDGEVLTNVRILSVSDYEVSLSHAGGVARVSAKRLPEPFQERFRFGLEMKDPSEASASVDTVSPAAQAASASWTDPQRKKAMQLNATLVTKKTRLMALEQAAAREKETEQPSNLLESIRTSALPEEVRIQLEREKQRKAVEINVKNAAITARAREIDSLRKDISAIQTELSVLYKADQ